MSGPVYVTVIHLVPVGTCGRSLVFCVRWAPPGGGNPSDVSGIHGNSLTECDESTFSTCGVFVYVNAIIILSLLIVVYH